MAENIPIDVQHDEDEPEAREEHETEMENAPASDANTDQGADSSDDSLPDNILSFPSFTQGDYTTGTADASSRNSTEADESEVDADAERPFMPSRLTRGDFASGYVFRKLEETKSKLDQLRLVNACAYQAVEAGACKSESAFKREWRAYLADAKKEEGQRTVASTGAYLEAMRKDDFFYDVKFNELTGSPERRYDRCKRPWTDNDDAEARTVIEREYGFYSASKYQDAFKTFCAERRFNPVQDAIMQTTWDGTARCEMFLTKYAEADNTPYVREVSRLLFAGGVARAFSPGIKFDVVPVLQGPQGCGKSTLVRWLALDDEFFTSVMTISGQRGIENLRGKFICELEELLATLANERAGTRAEERAKAYLTAQSDYYRAPYERRPQDNPRRCIFIGTTNRTEFLTDKTGNRRWYPVQVGGDGRRLYKREAEVKREIRQCWAEAYFHWRNRDEQAALAPRPELLDVIRAAQADAELDDWRVGAIQAYLEGKDFTCLQLIWRDAIHSTDSNPPKMAKRDSTELAEILVNTLKWRRGETRRIGPLGPQKTYYPPASF